MLFSSLTFLLIFLPVFFLALKITPGRWKNLCILLFSLLFYAWGEPVYVLIMLGSIAVNFALGRLIGEADKKSVNSRKAWLAVGIVINLTVLIIMKYTDMLIAGVNFLIATEIPLAHIALPIGISFYTFQTMSYLVDVYRGTSKSSKSIIDFAAYVSMFPQLIAGPIVRYSTVEAELSARHVDAGQFSDGVIRFSVGLSKKVLIANRMGEIYEEIWALGNVGTAPAWLAAFAYMFQIYFDFSGYSDMAIGLGLMMGFHFPENFNYPYIAESITDFWRRWHISLSTWFKEYVYIPLGGNRVGVPRHILNLFIVWGLTGLWHGADFNFLLWGLYYAVLLILEKYVWGGFLKKCPKIIGRIYSAFFILVGWVIFSHTGMGELGSAFSQMSGVCGGNLSYAWYLLKTHLPLFILAAALSMGAWPWLKKRVVKNEDGSTFKFCRIVFMCTCLALCISELLRGAYNPFLYFRF